jgi:hypothetical protein
MPIWTRIVGWLCGIDLNSIVTGVTNTLSARIKAQADTTNVSTQAELQMQLKQWDAQVENWQLQEQLLIAEHGWWVTRWQRPLLFYVFAFHIAFVVVASSFARLGWIVQALPQPLDWLEAAVLSSYFLLRSLENGRRGDLIDKVKVK